MLICNYTISCIHLKFSSRISFGYVAFMISLGGMAVLVGLTMLDIVNHEVGFYFTVVATIFTGIGCGGQDMLCCRLNVH